MGSTCLWRCKFFHLRVDLDFSRGGGGGEGEGRVQERKVELLHESECIRSP